MVFSVDDDTLKSLISDLEMSFGKVEVIHETQFQNAAIMAGMTQFEAEELSFGIGLRTAANHELPAVIVIEKLRDNLKGKDSDQDNVVDQDKEDNTISTIETVSTINTTSIIGTIDTVDTSTSVDSQKRSHSFVVEENEKSTVPTLSTSSNVQESPGSSSKYLDPEDSATSLTEKDKFESFVDMNMIKITPNGYVGNFLDRHLVYSIEDQNRLINLERGVRTCQVSRRFSDFVAVRDYLLAKYPFRCVPRLPAKRVQMFSDEAFLLDRQKSLRRFLGILSQHHMYKSDTLIQAFLYNQKEFQNLISDQKVTSPDREHMLLTQIPTADALIQASTKEASSAIENSRSESQTLASFCVQTRDQIKSLIDTCNREATCLTKFSTILLKSENVSKCFCLEGCESCAGDFDLRRALSDKLKSANESTESVTINEFEEIVEKFNLLIDLFESFNELILRGNSNKYNDFDEIRKEIGGMEVEIEKKRGTPEGNESAERIRLRIDALKQQWDEQDTFNKFIQFSVYDEMKWVHGHKIIIKNLLEQVALTISLKQRQWLAIFESRQ